MESLPRTLSCPLLLVLLTLLPCMDKAIAADWPAFRGPKGDGSAAPGETAPIAWGPEKNVRWKAPLPRPGNGSPIVSRGRVLVTSAEDEEGRGRSLYCFDADTGGKPLWVRTVRFEKTMPTHKTNPYGGSTPAADGQRVVVWHASAGLHCYDLDGKPLWSRDLGEMRHIWGYGSSPVLHDGRVILHSGAGKQVFVAALDLATGKLLWKVGEPFQGDGDYNERRKFMGAWTTPVIVRVGGKDQAIVPLMTRINAYDVQTGDIVWTCDGMRHDRGDLAYSAAVICGDLCFVTAGFHGPAMAVRLGGSGNVTDTHRLWRTQKNPQSIGSGVFVDGYVYRPNAGPGTIECVDPKTGRVLWSEEKSSGMHWASIVAVGGVLYATNQKAETIVFRPNPARFDLVAVNRLAALSNATPAVAGGHLFFRTDKHLMCVGR